MTTLRYCVLGLVFPLSSYGWGIFWLARFSHGSGSGSISWSLHDLLLALTTWMDSWNKPDTCLEHGLLARLTTWLIGRSSEIVQMVKDLLWDLSEGSKDQGSFLEVEDRFRCRSLHL